MCRYTRVHRRRQVDASVDSDCGRETETQAQEDHPAMVLGRPQKAQGRGNLGRPQKAQAQTDQGPEPSCQVREGFSEAVTSHLGS